MSRTDSMEHVGWLIFELHNFIIALEFQLTILHFSIVAKNGMSIGLGLILPNWSEFVINYVKLFKCRQQFSITIGQDLQLT